ncbi:MAG TPA: type II toxin-antitoxin system VapC family toxin [Ktedonobacterales bacterium]|nr:type II toxin-antitoxin system VapC family toxin [Ktedonobacterales bacterium]
MANYYLDSSTLVKRYVRSERGHAWTATLCAPASGNLIFISEASFAEVVAAFCRMARATPRRASIAQRDSFITLFRQHDADASYTAVPTDHAIYTRGADLCRLHPLRAYDAVQLACALATRDDARAAGVTPPKFVCADATLLGVAAAEGLAVENPNDHP